MAEPLTHILAYENKCCSVKLFVGGLSYDTTEQDLLSYFGQFGNISNVTIKYNPQTGHPRGFGFVTFTADGSIDAVLNNGPHTLKGRQIDPRKAKTKPICKKIFVGGLGSNVNEDEIRQYFGQFGTVEGVELPYDHARNRRREFCFVIFENEESADKACYEPKQNIGGRDVDVKKAQPQNLQKQNQRRNGNGYPNNGYGNGTNSYGTNNYGANSYGAVGYGGNGGNGDGNPGNNWRYNERGGYRQNNYQNNHYQKRTGPRPNLGYGMNPADTSNYNTTTNYHRQPDYM